MFEDLPALMPMQFFGLACDCLYLKGDLKPLPSYRLPSTSDCLDEEAFADFYCGWNEEKFSFRVDVRLPFQAIGEADFRRGDSLEIFIDTRDLKSKPVVSKFCHHFVFFPIEHQGSFGREISRFRNEDTHRLCSPEDLEVQADLSENSYSLSIDIPAHCLFGYEPQVFTKMGFTYRLNRADRPPQHFSVSSQEYIIEQHPALWATLKLER
ncbi:MAG TPA: hypothetical protein DCE71_01485 [Parachlamydiales bacterium]|nr:hypothetical protein [Parachlamydiales bacterium]